MVFETPQALQDIYDTPDAILLQSLNTLPLNPEPVLNEYSDRGRASECSTLRHSSRRRRKGGQWPRTLSCLHSPTV